MKHHGNTFDDFLPWILIVLLIGGLWISIATAEAYGSKCHEFFEGYEDGYCSGTPRTELCIPDGRLITVCYETDYESEREAYHAGYDRGKEERRKKD